MFTAANPIAMAIAIAGWVITQFGLIFRLRANAGASTPEQRDPLSILFFLVMSGSVAAAFWGSVHVRPDFFDDRGRIEIATVATLVVVGLAFFLSAIRVIGQNFAVAAQVREEGGLVTSGPYGIVRNPIYLSYYLLIIATPLAFGHLQNLIIVVPWYFIGAALRILREEQVLRQHFGAAFDAYAARVKRLIPFIW